MPDSPSELQSEEYYGETPVSVSHFVRVLGRYSGVIVLSLLAVGLLYLIAATAAYLMAARQKIVAVPFRLEFKGATEGTYPNGLKFSVADIVATPVLLEVFNVDGIGRFESFDRFSRTIFVLESNRELERLTAEYESKLADPKLTPVDRDRIEREFESKRASINKSEYALQYVPSANSDAVPTSVVTKAMNDILATWSRRAAIEKKALDYQVAVISPAVIDRIQVTDDQYLIPLLLLRQRVTDAIANATDVEDVPGAKLVRLPGSRLSIADIRAHLDEILRFRIEPVVSAAYRGASSNAVEVVKSQLAYDQRLLAEAQMRETALRNALLTYESEAPSAPEAAASAPTGTSAPTARGQRTSGGETVMPQLSDSFIDRVVDLTTRNSDRDYRQKLTNDIKEASLAVVPAQAAVKYDEQLLDMFQRGTSGQPPSPASLKAQWGAAVADVRDTIANLNAVYTLASRQLYPETEMYRVTGPAVARVDRNTSLARLFLYGVLTMLIAFPLIIVAVLLHNRIREEEQSDLATRREPAPAVL